MNTLGDRDIFGTLEILDLLDALAARGEQVAPELFEDAINSLLTMKPKTRLGARALLARIEREMEFFEFDSARLRPLIRSLVYDPDLAACGEKLARLLPAYAQAHEASV
jgi:hypothetical protein